MISPKYNVPVHQHCIRCDGNDELFKHTDEPALANYPNICLCSECIDDLMTEYNNARPTTCVLCGTQIEHGDPCHQVHTGLYTKNGFSKGGSLGLACGCVLRIAETLHQL